MIFLGFGPTSWLSTLKTLSYSPTTLKLTSNSKFSLPACMKLEEYQTAEAALETGASLASGDVRFTNLIEECDQRIVEEIGDLQNKISEEAPTEVISLKDV
ncbi:hypothetical protein Dsin_011799 [Dipteronia sinensis]|uniref:Uncharacterized protein n=1 Tax=Dipteronia sinensis TaxID=43782 RepID=A0AAE0AI56_9ROSI|nr:hypothetical protein Dsin_011799 [Dipteronia sinensis]